MTKSESKALRTRWSSVLLGAGIQSLTGKGLPPFGNLKDGRCDLRGLVISQFVKNATIRDVDLSHSVTEGFGQFGMCHVIRSCFREAKITSNLGYDFQECSFVDAKLSGVVLREKFVNCDFTSTNLSAGLGNQVQFVRCKFIKTNFKKTTLTHCVFEECEFAECDYGSGSLSFSKFINSPIESDSLGNTLMEKVVIDG